jgi:hypothetical protein
MDESFPRLSYLHLVCWFVILAALLSAARPGRCEGVACKPILTIIETRFAPVRNMQRTWTAIVLADAGYCATTSGPFEIDFIRAKEDGPELQFTKGFRWRPGRFELSVDFWFDEAVVDHRIGFVAPCVCRDTLM